jgi:transposase
MAKRYCINEKQVKELEAARKKNKNKTVERRLTALLLYAQGMKNEEIALRSGLAESYIGKLAGKYSKQGLEAIALDHRHSNRWNMTFEEEEAFLEPFKKAAEAGKIVSIKEIRLAYEAKIGHELKGHSQIYDLLERHGWRKVMPRSKHPKQASEEDQDLAKNKILCGGSVQRTES